MEKLDIVQAKLVEEVDGMTEMVPVASHWIAGAALIPLLLKNGKWQSNLP